MIVVRILLIGSVFFSFFLGSLGFSQETDDYLLGLEYIRDPFASQLPEQKDEPPPKVQVVVQAEETEEPIEHVHIEENANQVSQVGFHTENSFQTNPSAQIVSVGAFVIKGLVWNTTLPQAIIDDQILKVGDLFKGMQILSINKAGIEFSNNGVNIKANMSDQRK